MKILYISQQDIDINKQFGIYEDLLNSLIGKGHKVTLCCADSCYSKTQYIKNDIQKLEIKVPNQYGVNIIKKGLIVLGLESVITKAIKKYLKNKKFDLVLYATPPITFANVIKFCKKQFNCKSYLMLKDIFPQNAVDLGMMSTKGLTSIIYKVFRKKETKLYKYSDKIGCMSDANIRYLLEHNSEIDSNKVELFPNAVALREQYPKDKSILTKLNIDINKLVFIYGGNLGKPQGLDFLADGIKACKDIEDAHFIIVGKGSEKGKLFNSLVGYNNVTTLENLPVDEYNKLCCSSDVGMIMLDHRFTIPNYPSRALSYLENAMPIFACTDKITDIKELVEIEANCGKWCYSNDLESFRATVEWFVNNRDKLELMGQNGRKHLENNFDVEKNLYKIERMCSNTVEE